MIYYILFQVFVIVSVNAWDTEQLEVFDAIEEVKQNFYEILNVSKEAENNEIKSAFRMLSLKLHPDKNKETDTSEQFRNLVTVYEVLKSSSKRKYYNDVLVNGLPNWKSGIFYYRYVRKMGILEVIIIIFVITTIGQYLCNWGVYFEKKMAIEDQINRNRKLKSKFKMDEEKYIIEKPSVFDTLPIQIPKLIWLIITSIPAILRLLSHLFKTKIESFHKSNEPETEPVSNPILKAKTARKRNKFVVPEGPNFEVYHEGSTINDTSTPLISGGLWTDEDLLDLIKLVNKYSQGTPERWEKIAQSLNRSVSEVTYMANKMKENGYRLVEEKENTAPEKIKQKTRKLIEIDSDTNNWNQIQQKRLEEALILFPKGCVDRWDRISDHVPNKTKDECMQRFKYIAEDLKKRKQTGANDS
ncbi:dnaJ homolog subfamily C member 1 [Diabrotica virgifera virgifera]|uniref:DnaJ homolog subfamily C member 1 n=1 Tax=Diabrotica virgifera virgifera TaxID=50390 RepID=A0A6P7EXX8_DIAVI|nr:dnaJ homolog subfamily C member 1 [Diabrotica virgifera virgifera]